MSNGEEKEIVEDISGGGLGGMLGTVGSMFGPAGLAGGGFDFSSSAESRALSGRIRSGDITFGVKTDNLVIIAAVILGLYLLFGSKK